MQARVMLYKAVVHAVLIYGKESWLVMVAMLKVLELFHHWVARQIVGKTDQRTVGGECEWPPVTDALEIERLLPIKEYVQR